ncbi:LytTR family DNA-binding domain-containing protein [Saccharibacillus sp. CPCC 101409]|uniref:LytR/AlgR family response regulator transcription factor n=1 Tax=Saccharibacillus sp. CPCC 101409 TaxID=3058041 RepID=UPI002671D9F7|nr:LytTR family DNA-binding domain-containing protein [Saccharibacillus sp. CPCC 101409]MDO3409463.1 LytTR family DNA-binding domain-containing protein [Saccharibacillus sp. CPCC 101409]
MRIAVCDDDPDALEILKQQLQAYPYDGKRNPPIDCFLCEKDFLPQAGGYDIVFMATHLRDGSGLDLIRRIRRKERCAVVFLSDVGEHALEAFALDAVHYLIKPITETDFAEALRRCMERIAPGTERFLELRSRQTTIPVSIRNIRYIEIFNRVCVVHTRTGVIRAYATLDALFERLQGEDFIRAQRSFIVNMNFIAAFFFDRVVLKDGTEIVLSRKNRSALKAQYQRFLYRLALKEESSGCN